jgi:hypothetical protein
MKKAKMSANQTKLPRSSKSDLAHVDAHVIAPQKYDELLELSDDMCNEARSAQNQNAHAAKDLFNAAPSY